LFAAGDIKGCISVEAVFDGAASAVEYFILGLYFLDASREGGLFDVILMGL
jgi:hypothetical protein